MPFNFLKLFTGEEEPEQAQPAGTIGRPTEPNVNLPPEMLDAWGFDRQPTEEEVANRLKLEQQGVEFIDFSDKPKDGSQPQGNKNTMSPFAGDQMGIDKVQGLGTGKDRELGTNLKIDKVSGDVIPSIDENDIPEFKPMELQEEPSDVMNFINRIARGIPEHTSSLLKGLNTTFDMINEYAQSTGLFERIDPSTGGTIVDENFLDQSQQFNKVLDESIMPMLDAYLPTKDDHAFYSDLASGIGSGLFFMAGSITGAGLLGSTGKIATRVIPSMLGAGTMSQQMYEDAVNSGASQEEIITNYLSGGVLGATEGILGIGALMSRVGKRMGKNIVKDVLTGSGEEWFQESFQTLGQNLTVQETYDLSRDLFDGVGRSGAVALITGGLFSGGVSAVNRLLQKDNLTEDEEVLLQQARSNFNEVANEYERQIKDKRNQFNQLNAKIPTFINPSVKGNAKVIDNIVKSHNKNGGSSYGVGGKITKGYSVGTQKGTGKEIKGKKVTPEQILEFIDENKEILDNSDNFIGTWYEKETNTTHLDISTAVKTEEEAQELGRANDQIAVYDLKKNEEIPVLELDAMQLRDEQSNIPPKYSVPVFHFSDNQQRGMATDPSKFGQNSFTKADKRISPEGRTFFYTDPRQVKKDHPSLQGKKMFIGTMDARKIYDLRENAQKYGFDENDVFSIDRALIEAKNDGWYGVRYPLVGGEVINSFKPIYVERPDGTPSIGEIVSGRWDVSVKDAKKRLNSGAYGSQLFDVTTIPVVGTRFVSDMGIIMADKLLKTKTPFGTPQEFAERLINEFGDQLPIVRRFARQIYEYAKSIRDAMKKSPLTFEEVESTKEGIHKKLINGETGEYIPTGKGAIILGGDIADFEGGKRKHLGIDFPKDQALRVAKANKNIKMVAVGYKNKDSGKIYKGGFNQHHGMLLEDIAEEFGMDIGEVSPLVVSGFIGDDGKFYNRHETGIVTGVSGESVRQGISRGTFQYLDIDPRIVEQEKYRGKKSYPVWATSKGITKQISDSAVIHGNDTLIFMVYPNAWNSVKDNWVFQENVNNKMIDLYGKANVPKLPAFENWKNNKSVREDYIKGVKESVKSFKKGKPLEEQSQLSLDALAYEFGIENGINLTGKIKGVAKYLQSNFGKERKSPHKLYDGEIEGYNYQELEEPIDFNFVKEETTGTDLAVQGKIKEMTGKKREGARRNNLWRNIHQRGLTVTEGQSELIDAMILASEGDHTLLNQWLQKNENTKGEIVDQEQYDRWYKKNVKTAERLRSEANKSLNEFLKPVDLKAEDSKRDSKGRLPSHPDYDGQMALYSNPIFSKEMWRAVTTVGKGIHRGIKNFGKWSAEMIKQFGEWIKPALRSIYKTINQIPNVFKPVSNKELNYRQTEDNKKTPEENKSEFEEKRIMGTLPSQTKGYNMSREHPALSDMLDKILESMRTEFDVRRRGTIDNESLKEEAKRRAEHLTDDDIWNVKQGEVRNAEDLTAMRIYVADKVLKSFDEIKKLTTKSDPILIKDMTNELVEAMRMYEIVRAVGTELGRGVQSMSIPLTDDILEGMKHAMEVINSLDPDNKFGGEEVGEMLEDISKLPTETAEQKQTALEWTRYIFLNWILQNPLTDTANIFGNMSNLSFHISANLGNLGGRKVFWNSVGRGFKEGIENAKRVLHGEMEAISKFTENSPIKIPSSKKRSWKNYFRLLVPTTRLGIEDSFFRALGRNVEMGRMSYKVGKQLNVSPDEVSNAVAQIINDPKIEKYSRKEYKEMAKYLERIEDELVFQNELGQIGKGFQRISKVAFPIIPFVTTPANIIKFGISATPFGLLKLGKKDITQEEKNQIVRRAMAGSVLMSGIATMIASGMMQITGGGSEDKYERDLMEKLGYKPYHLYVKTPFGTFGGSYQNVNPMNTALAIVGDLFDKYRFNKFNNKPEEDLAWYNKVAQDLSTALLAIGSSVTDQSYLSGVRDLMDALAGRNPDWFMRTLTGYARMGGIQGIQRITGTEDRGRYETKGRAEEQIQKNNPFFKNDGLIESVSTFGNQRQSQYERFPLPITKLKEGTAYNWIEDNGLRLKQPSKTTKIGNRELTRKEYEIYAKGVGKIMDKVINQLWEQQNDPELEEDKKLSLEDMQKKLDKTYDSAKDAVMKKIKQLIYEKYQLEEGQK